MPVRCTQRSLLRDITELMFSPTSALSKQALEILPQSSAEERSHAYRRGLNRFQDHSEV